MRALCPDCGAALPQHTRECRVAPMLAMAEARGAEKALQEAEQQTAKVAQVAQARGVLAAAGQIAVLRHSHALVRLQDLQTIAGFACEHSAAGQPPCDEADEERGGCCNACWAARWARKVLEERGDDQQAQE